MKKKKELLIAAGIAALMGLPMVFATANHPDQQDVVSKATLSADDLNQQNNALPKEDIQRFITSIALIHHYYIKPVTDNKLFDNAMRGMVANLDPHSSYLDANDLKELKTTVSGEFVGVGIELTISKEGMLKVISPLDGSPAQKAGIQPNDYIIKINKELVRNMSLEEAVRKIKGKEGTPVTLTILRKKAEKPLFITLTRQTIHVVGVRSKLLEPEFGYIRITFFQGPLEKQLRDSIEKLKKDSGGSLRGLVLDLRNNPGGLLDVSADVASTFLDPEALKRYNNYIVYTKGRIPGADLTIKATQTDMIPNTPMVVLINGGSASASEIVAGALQDYKRAIILGTRSFGKGSVQTVLPITKDSAIKLTTALYYTPAGREIQAEGIVPDVIVPTLSVKNLDDEGLTIDEADFQNHLLNNDDGDGGAETPLQRSVEQQQQLLRSEMHLAKEDYQLYTALMMLKGVGAVGR